MIYSTDGNGNVLFHEVEGIQGSVIRVALMLEIVFVEEPTEGRILICITQTVHFVQTMLMLYMSLFTMTE